MRFEIHYTIPGDYMDHEDHFIVEGDTIEEVREIAFAEERKRGLTEEKNNLWSREIKER